MIKIKNVVIVTVIGCIWVIQPRSKVPCRPRLAVSDEHGRYQGIYRGIYAPSETLSGRGFQRRKLKNHFFMLFEALEWHHSIPIYCKWLNSYESLKKTWRIPPYEVKYHSIIVSEIRFCVKTSAAMLSKWTKRSQMFFIIIQEDIFSQHIDITPIGLAQHPLNLFYPVAWKDLCVLCIFRFNFVD